MVRFHLCSIILTLLESTFTRMKLKLYNIVYHRLNASHALQLQIMPNGVSLIKLRAHQY
jgi:ribosome maturation factor RimP